MVSVDTLRRYIPVLVLGGVPVGDVDNRHGGAGSKCERRDSNNSWSARWYFTAFLEVGKTWHTAGIVDI